MNAKNRDISTAEPDAVEISLKIRRLLKNARNYIPHTHNILITKPHNVAQHRCFSFRIWRNNFEYKLNTSRYYPDEYGNFIWG